MAQADARDFGGLIVAQTVLNIAHATGEITRHDLLRVNPAGCLRRFGGGAERLNRVNVLAWYGGVVRVDEVVRIVLYQYPLRADFAQSVLIKDGQMLGDIGLIAAGLVNAPGDDALCVDAQNGAHLWTQRRDGEPLVLRQQGVLMPYGNTLLAGLSGRLVAFNPDNGNVQWEAPLASPRGTNDVERLVDLVGPAARVGNVICARAFQSSVGCVDANAGRTGWAQTAKGAVGIAADAEYVFGAESNGIVQAWNMADGEKRWSVDRFQHRKLTAPLVLGRAVVTADESGLVHLLSKKDGSHLNRLTTDSTGVAVAPVVAADTLVVVTRGGGIYGFRPD